MILAFWTEITDKPHFTLPLAKVGIYQLSHLNELIVIDAFKLANVLFVQMLIVIFCVN